MFFQRLLQAHQFTKDNVCLVEIQKGSVYCDDSSHILLLLVRRAARVAMTNAIVALTSWNTREYIRIVQHYAHMALKLIWFLSIDHIRLVTSGITHGGPIRRANLLFDHLSRLSSCRWKLWLYLTDLMEHTHTGNCSWRLKVFHYIVRLFILPPVLYYMSNILYWYYHWFQFFFNSLVSTYFQTSPVCFMSFTLDYL